MFEITVCNIDIISSERRREIASSADADGQSNCYVTQARQIRESTCHGYTQAQSKIRVNLYCYRDIVICIAMESEYRMASS